MSREHPTASRAERLTQIDETSNGWLGVLPGPLEDLLQGQEMVGCAFSGSGIVIGSPLGFAFIILCTGSSTSLRILF